MIYEWETYIEGPRWAKVGKEIQKGVIMFGLNLDYLRTDKGFVRETIFFKVSGDKENVSLFREILLQALEDYNR